MQTLKERDEFSSRVDSTKETICRLEEELRSSTAALTASTTELGKHRSRAAQLQALVDAGERSRQEQEQGLRRQAATSQESQASVVAANARIGEWWWCGDGGGSDSGGVDGLCDGTRWWCCCEVCVVWMEGVCDSVWCGVDTTARMSMCTYTTAHTHTYTHIHTDTYAHIRTHIRTHIPTCTYTTAHTISDTTLMEQKQSVEHNSKQESLQIKIHCNSKA